MEQWKISGVFRKGKTLAEGKMGRGVEVMKMEKVDNEQKARDRR